NQAAPCFSSFLAETRSSQADNAQLRDFVLGNFRLCHVSITNACSGAQVLTDPATGANSIRYFLGGNVINDGTGALFNVAVTDAFPVGATNRVLNQPGIPGTGLAPGASAPYRGSFDFGSIGQVVNTVSVTASSTQSGPGDIAPASAAWNPCILDPFPRLHL